MGAFDSVSKHLIQAYPADIARFGLGRDDVDVMDVLDVEQPTVEARAADSVVRARVGGEEALVHTEFQTGDSTDTPMPRRMAGYVGRAVERHGLPVFSSVIYLRPDAGRSDPGCWAQNHAGHRLLVEYRVIRLIEVDGQRVLDTRRAGLLPFAALMGPAPGVAPTAWVRHCADAVEELPADRREKVELLAGMAVLGGLVLGSATMTEIIGEKSCRNRPSFSTTRRRPDSRDWSRGWNAGSCAGSNRASNKAVNKAVNKVVNRAAHKESSRPASSPSSKSWRFASVPPPSRCGGGSSASGTRTRSNGCTVARSRRHRWRSSVRHWMRTNARKPTPRRRRRSRRNLT